MSDRPTIAGPVSDAARIAKLESSVKALQEVLPERICTLDEDLVGTILRVQELEAKEVASNITFVEVKRTFDALEARYSRLEDHVRALAEDAVAMQARCARLEALLLTVATALDNHWHEVIYSQRLQNEDVSAAVEALREAMKEEPR